MAQNTTKGLKSKPQSGGRKKGGLTKKGKREIAPKNKQKVEEHAQKKVGAYFVPLAILEDNSTKLEG